MEAELLGWPADGPTLRLDYERFAYAGKFVMSSTGKAVAREDGELVGAVAFNADRTDETVCWLRYVTVRQDRKGEGIGPRLCRFVRDRALERGYEELRIAVNNPYAYEALHRAGFGFTGETTGIAELVLTFPSEDAVDERYREGLERFRDRELTDAERSFVSECLERGQPAESDDRARRTDRTGVADRAARDDRTGG
ncbi:putative acetyltransferase [Halovivax ruber XH-70]|uniref:Probable N-acetyltransferase 14 n=1 Tax=Halovivax ruber (strain DSM 18193 / JCM 13892 / XH-70) TaxID=797302 RepID=L0IAZ6_HALRX|nr:GNAT family N-acetyltransferase [Halovivax ruber]AGB15396.1 putative acetyltransferase [Halovivax ruber XH-70]